MKNNPLKIKVLLVMIVPIVVSACGGGSSDSGGAQNDVTSCITRETISTSIGFPRTTLTNTCDFTVNLGRGVVSIDAIVTLAPGGTDSAAIVGGIIACRPPSLPFDRDDSAGRDFACTD